MVADNKRNRALFVGAHPDDIELGAGGTILTLIRSGWEVFACVLTKEDDPTTATERKEEAVTALAFLGVPYVNIIFTDFPDGRLLADRETIGTVRSALMKSDLDPDVVFTHTEHENHNDHQAAHQITLATFRGKPILCYGIVKSLIASTFKPRIFIDISLDFDNKVQAFKKHVSQVPRINLDELTALDMASGKKCGFSKAEAFELVLQQGAQSKLRLIMEINSCPFHRFWYTLIGDEKLLLIHAIPVYRPSREWNWPVDKDREGIELLNRAFKEIWSGQNPIENFSCGTPNIESRLEREHILLSGGSVSNSITRDHFEHFPGLRYHISYEMPGYRDISIHDNKTGECIRGQYGEDAFQSRVPLIDVGVLTVMRNPSNPQITMIGCMGIHGYGSLGCYRVLSDRRKLSELMEVMHLPLLSSAGHQILIDYRVSDDEAVIRMDSLHSWGGEL